MNLLWDSPPGVARAGAIVVHGFARSPRRVAGIAGLLAARGFVVARPAVPSWSVRHSLHDEAWLDGLGTQVVDQVRARVPGSHVIGVGHSAGAAVVAGWAGVLDGMVLLDPVDRHGRIERLAHAGAVPAVRMICADASACNRHGAAAAMLFSAGVVVEGQSGQRINGSAHPDPERIPASLHAGDVSPPDPLARLACGRGGSPATVCRWGATLAAFADEWAGPGPAH